MATANGHNEREYRRGYLAGMLAALEYVDEGINLGWLIRFQWQVVEYWAIGDCSEVILPPLPEEYRETDKGFVKR